MTCNALHLCSSPTGASARTCKRDNLAVVDPHAIEDRAELVAGVMGSGQQPWQCCRYRLLDRLEQIARPVEAVVRRIGALGCEAHRPVGAVAILTLVVRARVVPREPHKRGARSDLGLQQALNPAGRVLDRGDHVLGRASRRRWRLDDYHRGWRWHGGHAGRRGHRDGDGGARDRDGAQLELRVEDVIDLVDAERARRHGCV
eukprot:5773221-Prymnesium_polylepis.3